MKSKFAAFFWMLAWSASTFAQSSKLSQIGRNTANEVQNMAGDILIALLVIAAMGLAMAFRRADEWLGKIVLSGAIIFMARPLVNLVQNLLSR